MRPVDKEIYTKNEKFYNPYGKAKPDLISALGNYCSFCERQGYSAALDVEHIENKKYNESKEFLWSNFLIACKNCNSIKGTHKVDFNKMFFPHRNNTFSALKYIESGLVLVNKDYLVKDINKIKNLIELIGLDRRPGHKKYSPKDDRWRERMQNWNIAKRYKSKLLSKDCDIETIIDLARARGFWSIWMDCFNDIPFVQKALIDNFDGTRKSFFEHLN